MNALTQLLVDWLLQRLAVPLARWQEIAQVASDDLRDRSELLAIEARADLARGLRIVLAGMLGFFAALASLMWLSAAVVLLAWDGGYRDPAILIVAGAWVCLAAFCIGWLRVAIGNGSAPLARSRQLLSEDLATLRETIGSGRQ